MTLGKKLTWIVSTILGTTVLLSAAGLYSISEMRSRYTAAVDRTAARVVLAGRLDYLQAELDSASLGYLMYTMTHAQRQADQNKDAFATRVTEMEKAITALRALSDNEEDRKSVADIAAGVQGWSAVFARITTAVTAGKLDEALRVFNDRAGSVRDTLSQRTQAVKTRQENTLAADRAGMASLQTMMTWTTVLLILLAVFVGSLSFVLVSRTSRHLRQLAQQIYFGADQVAGASRQIANASQVLAQSSSEQAAALEETSASTEELNSMTQQNAENARLAADQTGAAAQILVETDQRLEEMISSMRDINASSEKISEIIKVIDEIAFQTNILALNAAVEAARAGEAGLGFAVVADEVRNLAQRCAQAARDTSELIEESIRRSNEGKARLDQVVDSIVKLVKSSSQVKTLASEVHISSQEQAHGIEQIARALTQMQQVTQSTAASAEESASAGEQMSVQSRHLHHAVQLLQRVVGAGGTAPASSPATPTGVRHDLSQISAAVRRHTGPGHGPVAPEAVIPLDDGFQDF